MTESPWEDSLLERKVQSDLKDLLKTLVAFANSVKPGHLAVVLIGEMNDGTAQGVDNPDSIQKKVRATAESIYPPILWRSRIYEKESKPCVRIEIEASGDTPHFAGPAWVRRGSVTEIASDALFQQLIELRLSKVRELTKWLGKEVSVIPDIGKTHRLLSPTLSIETHPRWSVKQTATLISVNQFWVTFQVGSNSVSEPLGKLIPTWDDARDRLAILVAV